MYTKQKCHDGLKGACFELVNAAGQAEVNATIDILLSLTYVHPFRFSSPQSFMRQQAYGLAMRAYVVAFPELSSLDI